MLQGENEKVESLLGTKVEAKVEQKVEDDVKVAE